MDVEEYRKNVKINHILICGENVTYIISLNEQMEREWEKVKYCLRTCIND